MASLIRRMSRIMHVGVVHQLSLSLDTLIVDVDQARHDQSAMSLVRCNNLHASIVRNGKIYLETVAGSLSHGQLDFSPEAHFSARFTLFESVQGAFQPKTIKLILKDEQGNTICTASLDVSQHAGDDKVSLQVQFDGGDVALCFMTISCMIND